MLDGPTDAWSQASDGTKVDRRAKERCELIAHVYVLEQADLPSRKELKGHVDVASGSQLATCTGAE